MNKLVKLLVFTKSGLKVGSVCGFEFETETQSILRYEVKRSIMSAPILIHRTQVVSIDTDKMIVEDLAVPEDARAKIAMATRTQEGPVPVQSVIEE